MTSKRSKWPAAQHLNQAADEIRQATSALPDELANHLATPTTMAGWLDRTALEMAWLAPYRQHEIGHLLWQLATRAAHGVLGLPSADTCPVCHPERPKEQS
jgi:hypothetical protein